MQSRQQPDATAGSVKHPSECEWMEFLYEEISPSRKQELRDHLRHCPTCAAQISTWRSAMGALNSCRLPIASAQAFRWQPVLRWAAAAAAILIMGFLLGRTTSTSDRQLRELQTSVSRLHQVVHANPSPASDDLITVATQAAGDETLRVLNEYAQTLELQRTRDRQTTALVVHNLENRINTLRAELETVAVTTQDGLLATHQNLAQLASYTRTPERSDRGISNQNN